MTDQPTQPTDGDVDDPTVADDQLPKRDRDQIRDTAKALVAGDLRMDSDEFRSLPRRIQRRAWQRYQEHFEDPERVRERNAKMNAETENERAKREHREREEQEAAGG